MIRSTRIRAAAAALLAAGLTACSEGSDDPTGLTTGGTGFEPERSEASLNAMDEVLATEGWKSFQAVGAEIGAAAASVSTPMAHSRGGTEALFVPIISVGSRGTTFVFDPDLGRYIRDPERSGGPDNGVRFILYAVHPFTGQPVLEAEIGHADLLDEGSLTGPEVSLRLVAISEGITFLDYSVTAEGNENSGQVAVAGFLRGPGHVLDFDMAAASTHDPLRQTLDVVFELGIAEREFEVRGAVAGAHTITGPSGAVDLIVRDADQSIRVVHEVDVSEVSAIFYRNDDVFATAAGAPEAPEIRGADGEPLNPAEVRLLGHMLEVSRAAMTLFEGLMKPAGHLLALGWLL